MPDNALKTKTGMGTTKCQEIAMMITSNPTEEPTKDLHTGSKGIPEKKEVEITTGGSNTEKDQGGMMWIEGGRIGAGGMRMTDMGIGTMMGLEGGEKIATEVNMVIGMLMSTGRIMVGRESTTVKGGGLAAILERGTEDALHLTQEAMTVTTENHVLIIVILAMTGGEMREEVGTTTGLGEVLNSEVLLQVLTRPRIDV